MNKPLVSVCCLAYNHEKYIRQCLDGFVMQKTDFPFEVIVHDDASTDGTAEIIKEYAEKYPNIIKPIYETKNIYQDGGIKRIYCEAIYPQVEGDFISFCEGDDFWIDENKLRKQVDILNVEVDCNMCVHKVRLTYEDGKPTEETFPQNQMLTGKYFYKDFMNGLTDGWFFHTSSFLCRTDCIKDLVKEMPDFYKTSDLDDVPLLIYFGQLGGVYYFDKEMSCYRRESEGSWTSTDRKNAEKTIKHKRKMITMYEQYNEYTNGKYSDLCNHWINNERFMIAEIEHDFAEMSKSKYHEFIRNRNLKFKLRVKICGINSLIKQKLKKLSS